jgi:hypothetical protein
VPLRRKAPTPDSSLFFFIGSLLYDSTPPRLYAGGVRYLNILNIFKYIRVWRGAKKPVFTRVFKKSCCPLPPFLLSATPLFAVRYPPFFVFSEWSEKL